MLLLIALSASACTSVAPSTPAARFVGEIRALADSGRSGELQAVLDRVKGTYTVRVNTLPGSPDDQCRQGKQAFGSTTTYQLDDSSKSAATLFGASPVAARTRLEVHDAHTYECHEGRAKLGSASIGIFIDNLDSSICVKPSDFEHGWGKLSFSQPSDGGKTQFGKTEQIRRSQQFGFTFSLDTSLSPGGPCISSIVVSTSKQ
ncbi:MAG: hypothetical protein NVSMB18_19510 [Acetobacteraceae bacterium]